MYRLEQKNLSPCLKFQLSPLYFARPCMAPKGEFTNESSSLVFQPPEFDDDASRLKAEDRDVEVVVRVDLFQLLEDPG